MSGYVQRHAAIEAAGRAASSDVQPRFGFIWHARGQGFESPKLHVSTAQRHISIIGMIFDLLRAGKRMTPRRPGSWHGSPRSSDPCRSSWPQEVTLKRPFPGEQDGEQAGSNQAICPSFATALREPELPGVLRPLATRCHHRGLYPGRNAITDRLIRVT
jgi:hypothetical protein